MAVGVLGVLSLSGATLIEFANSNNRTSEYSKDNNGAYTLAEAGINEIMAVLSNPKNNAMKSDLLPQTTSTYEDGTVTWKGTLDPFAAVWSVTSTGRRTNPTGPNTKDVARTLTAKIPVTPTVTQNLNNPAWNYIFATRTGNVCDETLTNNVVISSALYVMGNLCLDNGAKITGGPLVVKGKLTMAQTSNEVGSSTDPIGEAHIAGGCRWYNQHAHPDPSHPQHPFCSDVDHVYAKVLDNDPTQIQPPVPDWDNWYLNAIPGPKFDCTTKSGSVPVFDNDSARNNSISTVFNLTPTSSYTCYNGPADNPIGEISWNASTNTLKVRGTIYIDGSLKVEGGGSAPPMKTYDGQATIYLSGSFVMNSKQKLCAVAAGSECDRTNWNPNTELLTIVAAAGTATTDIGISLASENQLQAALFAKNAISIGNNSKFEGPMVASVITIGSGVLLDTFPYIASAPAGMPGNPAIYAQPNPPQLYAG